MDDMRRHLADLADRSYERQVSREEKEALMLHGVRLARPVALRVLRGFNEAILAGTGTISTDRPRPGSQGLTASWRLTWPDLRKARNRFNGRRLEPVRVTVVFPPGWVHPHVAIADIGLPERVIAWPFQVVNQDDAQRLEPVFGAIVEAEVHERIYQADVNWRIIPQAVS